VGEVLVYPTADIGNPSPGVANGFSAATPGGPLFAEIDDQAGSLDDGSFIYADDAVVQNQRNAMFAFAVPLPPMSPMPATVQCVCRAKKDASEAGNFVSLDILYQNPSRPGSLIGGFALTTSYTTVVGSLAPAEPLGTQLLVSVYRASGPDTPPVKVSISALHLVFTYSGGIVRRNTIHIPFTPFTEHGRG
jgi:hypothetical protein